MWNENKKRVKVREKINSQVVRHTAVGSVKKKRHAVAHHVLLRDRVGDNRHIQYTNPLHYRHQGGCSFLAPATAMARPATIAARTATTGLRRGTVPATLGT